MDQSFPPDVYATFTGGIDQQSLQRIFQAFGMLVSGNASRVHLLIQSNGGFVEDGIAVHNFIRNLPLEITTYNAGGVQSIAVLMYLAGKVRKTSRNSSFLIHKTSLVLSGALTAEALAERAKYATWCDVNSDAILRDHLKNMPAEKWIERDRADLLVSANDAIQFGLAHEIADFAPPPGSQLSNI